jgi:hypothetical protein
MPEIIVLLLVFIVGYFQSANFQGYIHCWSLLIPLATRMIQNNKEDDA